MTNAVIHADPMESAALENEVEVQRRPLTPAEAEQVIAQIKASGKITGYSRREWTKTRDVFVLVNAATSEPLAVLLFHHLWGGWTEASVLFVLEGQRKRGYGKALLHAALRTLSHSDRDLVIFFSEPHMEYLVREADFEIYESERDFARRGLRDRLFIQGSYKLQWLLSSRYRLQELWRKRNLPGAVFRFKVGVLPESAS